MLATRWIACVTVAALTFYGVRRLVWEPYRCDIAKNRSERMLLAIIDLPATPSVVERARQGIADMQRCVAVSPTDAGMYMTLAAHERMLDRRQEAADAYTEALKYDRRPELFLNLGQLELQMNQRERAMVNLTRACLFNPNFVNEIPETDRDAVLRAVRAEQARRTAEAQQRR